MLCPPIRVKIFKEIKVKLNWKFLAFRNAEQIISIICSGFSNIAKGAHHVIQLFLLKNLLMKEILPYLFTLNEKLQN